MTERENLFRPIHKGLRAMIYHLGTQLQSTDFTDDAAARGMVSELRNDLMSTMGDCMLCLMYAHSQHEEKDFFEPVRTFDPDAIKLMMLEHAEVGRQIRALAETGNELLRETTRARRIEVGDRLNLEANDLFAFYLQHMNNEEATIVPLMWERFSDEELRKMRSKYHTSVPVQRLEAWMRWALPSMNVHELEVFFGGLREDGPPELFEYMNRLGSHTVDPTRWQMVRQNVGF